MMGRAEPTIVEDLVVTMEDIFEDLHPENKTSMASQKLTRGRGQPWLRKSSWTEAKKRRHRPRRVCPRNMLLPAW